MDGDNVTIEVNESIQVLLVAKSIEMNRVGIHGEPGSEILLLGISAITLNQLSLDGIEVLIGSVVLRDRTSILQQLLPISSLLTGTTSEFRIDATIQIINTCFSRQLTRNGLSLIALSPNTNLSAGNGLLTIVLSGETYILNITHSSFTEYALFLMNAFSALIQNSSITRSKNFGLFLVSVSDVIISESAITENEFGIYSISSPIQLLDSKIMENNAGITVLPQSAQVPLFFTNVSISYNTLFGITMISYQDVTFKDCNFIGNEETAIMAVLSRFEFMGQNMFLNNSADRGSGLFLVNSTVHFGSDSNTVFKNNTAREHGGAINIVTLPINVDILRGLETLPLEQLSIMSGVEIASLTFPCFYTRGNNAQVSFHGNNANRGGMDIFGATPLSYYDECSIFDNSLFYFDDSISTTSQVASEPSRVCFCKGNVPQCTVDEPQLRLNETRFPGENFNVSVVLVGFRFGRVAGAVHTTSLMGTIPMSQEIQTVDFDQLECGTLTYTVSSNETNVILVLAGEEVRSSLEDIETNIRALNTEFCNQAMFLCTAVINTPVYINVTLQACPLGFALDDNVCDCDKNLMKFRENTQVELSCEIGENRNAFIYRQEKVWVGMDISENDTDVYYWHENCPNRYCRSVPIGVVLTRPDNQCNLNRRGVLCGKCQQNFSLELGGNSCIECDNSFLGLLILFALLGILLVALIKLLDLTVANGTINGLIFYANVVWINNSILFPQQARVYYILTVPIAWINLDFGIETCFGENLDQAAKSYLQFVFPVYIWCIAGLIIIVSHYSTRATKLFGRNSVAVLATLFLLSYGKLFRNITDVFTFADINSSRGGTRKVWSLDGNIEYGVTPVHIGLIIVALIFLILFWLPFTLSIVFVPFLRSKSHLRPLQWITTLQPFYDTYFGPFKSKQQHQVWTGLLLISRALIMVVFAATSTTSPNFNILFIVIISVTLQTYSTFVSHLYRKWYVSLFEYLYLLNLCVLGGTYIFYQLRNNDRVNSANPVNPVAIISVSIGLFQFGCILVFHIVKQALLLKPMVSKWLEAWGERRLKKQKVENPETVAPKEPTKPTTQVVSLKPIRHDPSRFREDIFEFETD